ncbi:hypothetical protein [Bosea sp. 2RAB26]|uniref:hypothetical protein n=1 Tax=Bosea sp. 2RAB26 TaxID=3237476 RepID=UPI003F9070AA
MDENVLTTCVWSDESITFGFIVPLDRSIRHFCSYCFIETAQQSVKHPSPFAKRPYQSFFLTHIWALVADLSDASQVALTLGLPSDLLLRSVGFGVPLSPFCSNWLAITNQ